MVQRLLKNFELLGNHRGCQRTVLGQALFDALHGLQGACARQGVPRHDQGHVVSASEVAFSFEAAASEAVAAVAGLPPASSGEDAAASHAVGKAAGESVAAAADSPRAFWALSRGRHA